MFASCFKSTILSLASKTATGSITLSKFQKYNTTFSEKEKRLKGLSLGVSKVQY